MICVAIWPRTSKLRSQAASAAYDVPAHKHDDDDTDRAKYRDKQLLCFCRDDAADQHVDGVTDDKHR